MISECSSNLRDLEAVRLITFRFVTEDNGHLVFAETPKDIPFNAARFFYISNVIKGDLRGEHAHKICEQLLVCLKDQIEVTCTDGVSSRKWLLNSSHQALYIPPSIWASQRYLSDQASLLVLASHLYDSADYIRDFDEYLRFRKNSKGANK
jgi:UDP-2-acetamido-3-amino-2,3-dideoxy-glucuronate N-acetyltransferase